MFFDKLQVRWIDIDAMSKLIRYHGIYFQTRQLPVGHEMLLLQEKTKTTTVKELSIQLAPSCIYIS